MDRASCSSKLADYASRDGTDGIWVMDADGSNQRYLAEGGERNWSPPGDEITIDCGFTERRERSRVAAARTVVGRRAVGGCTMARPTDRIRQGRWGELR